MAELFFIATTIFVAYVLFAVTGDKKKEPAASPVKTPAAPAASEQPVKAAPPTQTVEKTATSKAKTTSPKAQSTPAPADSLKNPKTGEIAKVPGNYAFAKRWIKDALVEEGLLDKVYKNNELNEANTRKIHDALQQLKALEKYQ